MDSLKTCRKFSILISSFFHRWS